MSTELTLADRCALIRELTYQYNDLIRANTAMTNRMFAQCRRYCGGDKDEGRKLLAKLQKDPTSHPLGMAMVPYIEAQAPLIAAKKQLAKQMEKGVVGLPGTAFVASVRGFGLGSYAQIIGETGGLHLYPGPASLWKRMGLAVMPDGNRQRRIAGDEAIAHGYCPRRRALMYVIGECVMKAQSGKVDDETGEVVKEPGRYRAIYDERKALELARDIPKGHAHNRALRWMQKRLLRDLWAAVRSDLGIPSSDGAAGLYDVTAQRVVARREIAEAVA